MSETEKLVNEIYDAIKADVDLDGNFTPATLIIILPKLMQLAGTHAELDGAHKKTVVINVINRIITDTVTNQDINGILLQLTPIAIDTMYDVWVHRYIFKEMAEGCITSCQDSCGSGCGPSSKKIIRKANRRASVFRK